MFRKQSLVLAAICVISAISAVHAQERSLDSGRIGGPVGVPGGTGSPGQLNSGPFGNPFNGGVGGQSFGGYNDDAPVHSYVPRGSSCPPRCPSDLIYLVRAVPVLVYNLDERNAEITRMIEQLHKDVELTTTIAKAVEILAKGWVLEWGIADTISNYAAELIAERIQHQLKSSLDELAEAAFSRELRIIVASEPYFWDVRPESREKRAILEQAASDIESANRHVIYWTDDAAYKTVPKFVPADGGTKGQVLYRPGNAIRQGAKISAVGKWINQ